jgi:membrane-associated phospholipid phosphatase
MKDRPEHEHQALWAVDPDVSVEGVAALPQPGRLGIPALIRRQRRAPEGQAHEDGEARRRQREQSWGPPRADLDRRTQLLAGGALAAALAVAIFLFGLSLTTDRFLLILLAPALVLRRGRLYLRDFGLFALLMLIYSELRGLAHVARPDPFYVPQLDLDKWLFGGTAPTVELQKWWWTGSVHWYDQVLIDVSKLHFIVPPLLAFALWNRRRALFFRFATSMLTLSFAAAITFAVFPAAPPWAAGHALLTPTVTRIDDGSWSAVPRSFSLSSLIQPNPYAAIPSLHGGYAFLVFLFVAGLAWRTRWRWPAVAVGVAYFLALSFARVYTGDHYVIDLVIGYAYAAAAFVGVNRYWRRHQLPE